MAGNSDELAHIGTLRWSFISSRLIRPALETTKAALLSWRWLVGDLWLRRAPSWVAAIRDVQGVVARHLSLRSEVRFLMDAHRYRPSTRRAARLRDRAIHLPDAATASMPGEPIDTDLERIKRRVMVLKAPMVRNGTIEKGVVVIKFTETIAFFVQHVDCESLLRFFHVVLEPSWSGYARPTILAWLRLQPQPVIVEASERTDYALLEALRGNLVPVSFGSSDWVDFRVFCPLSQAEKTFDAVYVGNYSPVKRHHVLLKAVRRLRHEGVRVALVCGSWGKGREAVKALIRHYGVNEQVTLFERLSQAGVNQVLNASRVNTLLSVKEGSNRSVFEGLFANVPAIVLRSNIGVNKDYINDATGVLIEEDELAEAIVHFRQEGRRYRPREWAMEHISPIETARKLSRRLKEISEQVGEPWTADVVPKVNAPELKYFSADHQRQMPAAADVLGTFLRPMRERLTERDVFRRLGIDARYC